MGVVHPQPGVGQAQAVLDSLARDPRTARRICARLAAHFSVGPPDPQTVQTLTTVFTDTDGDLGAVHRALIDAASLWAPGRRLTSPQEAVVAMGRALGADELADATGDRLEVSLFDACRALGQAPFDAPSPQGWPDRDDAWSGAEAVLQRMEMAQRIGRRLGRRIGDPVGRAEALFGGSMTQRTHQAIGRAPDRATALGLLLISPELMRR